VPNMRFNMDRCMKNLGYLTTMFGVCLTYVWILDKFLMKLCA